MAITSNTYSERMQTRREWSKKISFEIKHYSPPKKYQYRILYLGKLSFKNKEEIKTSLEKQKLKRFVVSISVLQEILKELL